MGLPDSFPGQSKYLKQQVKRKALAESNKAPANTAFGVVCRYKRGESKGRVVVG